MFALPTIGAPRLHARCAGPLQVLRIELVTYTLQRCRHPPMPIGHTVIRLTVTPIGSFSFGIALALDGTYVPTQMEGGEPRVRRFKPPARHVSEPISPRGKLPC